MTPTVHVDLGVAWITRGDQQIHLEADEIPAIVAALLVELDRLGDAA